MRTGGEILEGRKNHVACMIGKTMLIHGGINAKGHILKDMYLLDLCKISITNISSWFIMF
jgi:hypothetical protein